MHLVYDIYIIGLVLFIVAFRHIYIAIISLHLKSDLLHTKYVGLIIISRVREIIMMIKVAN